jgi:hypothetical protein
MEMLGAITGLIGAGLQAQANHDQLMFQYAKFNWEKQRAATQDRFAQASRSDMFGNKTKYDEILNEWNINLTPTQKELMMGGEKEQLNQLKDAIEGRKIKRQVQERARSAVEPFKRAAAGYQYDLPRSEGAIRSELTGLLATNEMMKTKAEQALLMRQAARLGRGADASKIISSADRKLGNAEAMNNRMLQARNEAVKEFAGRQTLHEAQWGAPMKMWGELMAQGGDIPGIPKSAFTDTTGAQQQAMLTAFNQGTRDVGGAFDSLASAAGKSVDLSGIAKSLAGAGKSGQKAAGKARKEAEPSFTGITDYDKSQFWDEDDRIISQSDYTFD